MSDCRSATLDALIKKEYQNKQKKGNIDELLCIILA